MSSIHGGDRPASYPSPPSKQYQAGALALRQFLQRMQKILSRERLFFPALLREQIDYTVNLRSLDYRKGFMDALGAFVLLTLEGCQIDLENWDVLAAVKQR